MIIDAVLEARACGARMSRCAEVVGVDARTLQRWFGRPTGEDRRRGPRTAPHNRLTEAERRRVVEVATSLSYRDLSPKQIVPRLADSGCYLASESTFYRVLREEQLLTHRGRSKPRESRSPAEHCARGPSQVWSWDITYLRSPVRGSFFYLYLIVDVWSRNVVGWRVHEEESSELAADLVVDAVRSEQANPRLLVLHQDNGGPMKGATLKATLEGLGVAASYSRPRVSDDNPFSESLFRTLKYRPNYPSKPFSSLEDAQKWVSDFVHWYNHVHLHSGIGFVTPADRHARRDTSLRAHRRAVYEAARRAHPERWSGAIRAWTAPDLVVLNPSKQTRTSQLIAAHAA